MKTNAAGIALIKEWEGCRRTAYRDAVGVWTIGYGHTAAAGPPEIRRGMRIPKFVAEEILIRDLTTFELAVLKKLDRIPNDNQFAAMVSLCYNIGPGNFAKSTVCKAFNAGNLVLAANAFARWNKAGGRVLKGLTRRREAEQALFLTPTSSLSRC